MTTKIITSFFTKAGVPQTGLVPTINIWQLDPTNPSINTLIINGDLLTEIGQGLYRYNFTTYDITQNYLFLIDGGATLSNGERYNVAANESYIDDVSSGVWNEPATSHTGTGTMGLLENQIKADTTSISISMTTVTSLITTLLKYEKNRTKIDKTAKTLTVYDDDGLTPLKIFDLKDSTGALSIIEVVERMPQ